MTDLGVPRGPESVAYAINNRGQVVLRSGTHVYLWEAGSTTDLGTLVAKPGRSVEGRVTTPAEEPIAAALIQTIAVTTLHDVPGSCA